MKTMNQAKVIYNEADMDDIAAISAMFCEHLRQHPEYISHGDINTGIAISGDCMASDGKEKWERYLMEMVLEAHDAVLTARCNGKIIGFAIFEGLDFGYGAGPVVVINDILVLPEFRGRGIGKTLLEKGLDMFRNSGIKNCFIPTGFRNQFAQEFFRRQGARPATQTFHLIINDPSEIIFPEETTED